MGEGEKQPHTQQSNQPDLKIISHTILLSRISWGNVVIIPHQHGIPIRVDSLIESLYGRNTRASEFNFSRGKINLYILYAFNLFELSLNTYHTTGTMDALHVENGLLRRRLGRLLLRLRV
jgi:hypothetical protein